MEHALPNFPEMVAQALDLRLGYSQANTAMLYALIATVVNEHPHQVQALKERLDLAAQFHRQDLLVEDSPVLDAFEQRLALFRQVIEGKPPAQQEKG